MNWTSFAFGIIIIGLELGYLLAYRVGWKISLGSPVANICLAVILICVGILFYNESINVNKILGFVLCASGLIFIYRS